MDIVWNTILWFCFIEHHWTKGPAPHFYIQLFFIVIYQSQWSRHFRLIFNTFVTWIHTFSAFFGVCQLQEQFQKHAGADQALDQKELADIWIKAGHGWCLEDSSRGKSEYSPGKNKPPGVLTLGRIEWTWMNQLLVATWKLKEQRNKEKYLAKTSKCFVPGCRSESRQSFSWRSCIYWTKRQGPSGKSMRRYSCGIDMRYQKLQSPVWRLSSQWYDFTSYLIQCVQEISKKVLPVWGVLSDHGHR